MVQEKKKGFTLIELLIVIAIILILIAIALPNFIEAQMRARVANVKAELRTIETALYAYRNDNPRFPFAEPSPTNTEPYIRRFNLHGVTIDRLFELSTPVKYVESVEFADPFFVNGYMAPNGYYIKSYFYLNYETFCMHRPCNKLFEGWGMSSLGPDIADSGCTWLPVIYKTNPGVVAREAIYSPTNGTRSKGDICKYAGQIAGAVAELGR